MSKGHKERKIARSVKKQQTRQERQLLISRRKADKRRVEQLERRELRS